MNNLEMELELPKNESLELDVTESPVTRVPIEHVQQNGEELPIENKTVNVITPTKTSELENDSDFIDSQYHDDTKQDTLESGTNIKTINGEDVLGSGNLEISGLPEGGTTGQMLVKNSDDDFDAKWENQPTSATWGSITGTLNNQTDLKNALDAKANNAELATVAKTGAYSDLSGKPTVPTKVSDLTNDSGFQTATQLSNAITTHNQSTTAHQDIRNAIPEVVNNVTSTDTAKALSAKQGKDLNDRINNLQSIGRFLALWNCATGLPLTNPSGYPYQYHTGDYFRISNVDTTNYMPEGDTYMGVASTTEYSGEVVVGDIWFFDGTTWKLQVNHETQAGVMDVKVNGTSVVSESVANIDLTGKQDTIQDLADIRQGASAGATAVQPNAIADMATQTWVGQQGYQNATQVESAITGKGYQTATQVETAITGKGYQTSAQVESAITSKGYATETYVNNIVGNIETLLEGI